MNAVDTNILIYANDSREPEKRKIAQKVIAELTDGVLLWDSTLIAACLQSGVKTLYSEDFSDQFPENGLVIINPF